MRTKWLYISILLVLLCISCIQDEPLNPEADILSFSLPDHVVLTEATINQTSISINVRKNADLTALIPIIEITEGATINPSPELPQDFSRPVSYVVTAADGVHNRQYTVQTITASFVNYDFENWKILNDQYAYETPLDYDEEGKEVQLWDSSNKGIVMYRPHLTTKEFPVCATISAYAGRYAAELQTQEGPGNVLNIIYIPVVAGSLFTGKFDLIGALANPLLGTQFGQPFYEKPITFRGAYTYKAGPGDYIDPQGKPRPEMRDSCAVYSVLYRSDKDLDRLDGTNVLTHPNIVALAMLPPEMRAGSEGEGFNSFEVPFEYKPGVELDFEKYSYKLAIVFSSSFYGDRYEGTPGSHLVVDDIRIITEGAVR